jgi:hypothetical protein
MNVANAPNHAGNRQQTSFKFISFHLIPILAIIDAIIDIDVDDDDNDADATSVADLTITLDGGFIIFSHSNRPNQMGNQHFVNQTAVTCIPG